MAFTYAITTDRGRVRLHLSDTVDAGHYFTDVEIDAFLTAADNLSLTSEARLHFAAYIGWSAIAGDLARRAVDYTDERGSVSESARTAAAQVKAQHHLDLSGASEASALPTVGVIFDNLPMDEGYTEV